MVVMPDDAAPDGAGKLFVSVATEMSPLTGLGRLAVAIGGMTTAAPEPEVATGTGQE